MVRATGNAISPPEGNLLTAREAIEPLYDELELETDRTVLTAAARAGWTSEEAKKALASLRLHDALSVLGTTPGLKQES